jgi:hypothetical protein
VKCVRCRNDSKYSERSGGTCPKCNGKFAFEPKSGDVFTDPAFEAAIERVSAGGAVRFTAANLYYELARARNRARSKAGAVVLAVVTFAIGGVAGGTLHSAVPLLAGLVVGGGFVLSAVFSKPEPTPVLTPSAFAAALGKWKYAHGVPAKLVHRVAPSSANEPTKKALPSELAAYSFDRAVICDRSETVDLLLANNFHFENNCAVLAVTRYPDAVFAPVLEMLRRNPKIEVFALHDASVEGHGLARQLATSPEWFKGIGRVTDTGLLVKHAMKMRGLWQAESRVVPVSFPDLTAEENAWLTQYSLALAAIRPEQVIKRLFRAMTQPGTEVTTDDGGTFFVGGSFGGSDAGTSDGGGDSFG